MEKRQAVEFLEYLRQDRNLERTIYGDALNMAIDALKAQLLQEDTISRQAAIDALNEYFARIGKLKRRGLTEGEKAISLDTVGTIKTLPPAQPERKKGEWSDGYRWQRCSLCKQTGKKSWNYCPNCGADMRGEKDG